MKTPKGKYAWTATVGEKGQIYLHPSDIWRHFLAKTIWLTFPALYDTLYTIDNKFHNEYKEIANERAVRQP